MFLVLLGSVLISWSPVFAKLAHVGPSVSGFYRSLIGGLALVLVAIWRREGVWAGGRALGVIVVAGVLFAADLFFWHRSVVYVGPGLATILGNFQAFFVAAVGVLLLGERATWRFLVAVPLAIVGLVLLVGIEWSAFSPQYRLGVVFGLLTAVVYTGYLLSLRTAQRMKPRFQPTIQLALISLLCALLLSGSVTLEGGDLSVPDTHTWVVLLLYGVMCQAFGWLVIARGLQTVDASRVSLMLLLQPTLAFIWDIVLFARPTTGLEVFGALIALGAIYLGTTGHQART